MGMAGITRRAPKLPGHFGRGGRLNDMLTARQGKLQLVLGMGAAVAPGRAGRRAAPRSAAQRHSTAACHALATPTRCGS